MRLLTIYSTMVGAHGGVQLRTDILVTNDEISDTEAISKVSKLILAEKKYILTIKHHSLEVREVTDRVHLLTEDMECLYLV